MNKNELRATEVLGLLAGSPEDLRPSRFRISRPCYDKFHRCPGWAGGGTRYARVRRCDNGHISYHNEERLYHLWKWRLYRCPKCRVIVLPYVTRWADWRWWRWQITHWARNVRYWLEDIHSDL